MAKPIIAAVDPHGEDAASAALGLTLARLLGAPLILAGAYALDLSIDNLYPDYARTLEVDAADALERVAARLADPDVPVTTVAVPSTGSHARALHELAEERDARLLVIGSSRRGAVGRALPEAVTDRLLHGAPCPVAVAVEGDARPLRRIGVAFTDSPDGHVALTAARELAVAGRLRLRVLTVEEPLDLIVAGLPGGVMVADAERVRRRSAEAALQRGLDGVPEERSDGGRVLSGPPAAALAAASQDLDLLVCGSRGHGPLRTLVLGGTAHALVRHAACPVLVVPLGASLDVTPEASVAGREAVGP